LESELASCRGEVPRYLSDLARRRGNTEETPAWPRASTRGHSISGESFGFLGFRDRGDPRLPSLPSSELNGKEGVDGSSPSEGLHKSPANGRLVLPAGARFECFAGTKRVHLGTGGHSRARATSRGTAWRVLERLARDHYSKSSCTQTVGVARSATTVIPPSLEGVVAPPRPATNASEPQQVFFAREHRLEVVACHYEPPSSA
jgi:hypothetical protein